MMLESPSRIAGAAHRHTGKGSEGVGERSTSLRRGPREETCRSPCQFSTTARMRLSSALEVFLWQQKVRVSVGLGCPRPIAGRLLRPSWPPLSRRRLRFAIHGSAGRLRRFLGRGQPILHKLQKPNREPISDRWSGDTGTLEKGARGSGNARRAFAAAHARKLAAPLPVLRRGAHALASDLWHCRCSFPLNRGWGL